MHSNWKEKPNPIDSTLKFVIKQWSTAEIKAKRDQRRGFLAQLKALNPNSTVKKSWKPPKPVTMTYDYDNEKLILSLDYEQVDSDGNRIYSS